MMRILGKPRSAILLALVVFMSTTTGAPFSVAELREPDGLWTGPMQGQTPSTLNGARVIGLAGLVALLPQQPVLIDVGPAQKKPEDLPRGRLWLPTHRSIPGAAWFPGAGAAVLEPAKEIIFFRRMEELTGGDRSKPLVIFCRPECWGSWNAGKRLVARGYSRVHWFPGGITEWQEAHDVRQVTPEKGWGPEQ
jgi:PQQ-dependent catabolism-associated CXXCW motif protein